MEKVIEAVSKMRLPKEAIMIEKTQGHYGNEIHVLKANIKRPAQIRAFFDSPFFLSIRKDLYDTIPERMDEKGFLYFRTDKQDLALDIFRLNDRGDVRAFIKILSYPFRREKVIENAKKLFGDRPEGY